MKKGFTLLELLVVIAIIGILSSVVMVSLSSAKSKARDARRASDINQIQKAIDLYYDKYGVYPGSSYGTARTGPQSDGCGVIGNWCLLKNDLSEFIPKIPTDPLGNQSTYIYNYKYNSINNPNGYYGLGFVPENPASFKIDNSGFMSVGSLPSYCSSRYSGSNAAWAGWDGNNLCSGGN